MRNPRRRRYASSGDTHRRSVRKKRTLRRVTAVLVCFVLVVGGLVAWFFGTAGAIVNTGTQGVLSPTIATKPEYQGDVVNLLVLGLDYEEGRTGWNTDMIMYVHLDRKNKTMNMLQIPRDMFVGSHLPTGGTGKINALYSCGADEANPVNNLAQVINEQLQLPVDHYLTIDMDGFKALVDHFNGIDVYVPKPMAWEGSSLPQGWNHLNGDAAEFFVRCRKGPGFANSDMDRVVNQRYFYSALFHVLRTATVSDIIKLMPVFTKFCNTDLSVTECMALGIDLLSIPNENIIVARVPTYQANSDYTPGSRPVNCAADRTATLLNQYFRAEGEIVTVDMLNIYLHDANFNALYDEAISSMADVTASEEGLPPKPTE